MPDTAVRNLRPSCIRIGCALALYLGCTLALALAAGPAEAIQFRFSTTRNETFQGTAFNNEEVGIFETTDPVGFEVSGPILAPNPTLFTTTENLDAYSIVNGVHYFSLVNGATIDDGSLPFGIDNDDIVAWNPGTGEASLFFDAGVGNVDALSFHSDGEMLLSFTTGVTFHGLSLQDGDVVKFDPTDPLGTRVEFFDEDTFAPQWDIDGYSFVSVTEQYFTTVAGETLAGVAVADGDVILWDGTSVSVVVTESAFGSSSGGFDLNALAVPAPGAALLAGLAALGTLAAVRRDEHAST